MTKFEEEFEHELDYFIERELSLDEKLSFGARDALVKFFSGWRSPEHIEKEIQMKLLKLQQQALPVVPDFVDRWYEFHMNGTFSAVITAYAFDGDDKAVVWLGENGGMDLLCKMKLYGYTVEKPQLFYIELPNVFVSNDSVFVSKVENGTILEFIKGKDCALAFTEQEIKSVDERYWQFAVPVEGMMDE